MLRKRKKDAGEKVMKKSNAHAQNKAERKGGGGRSVHWPISVVCTSIFLFTLVLLSCLIQEERRGHDPSLNRIISLCTGSSFLTSFCLRCICFLLDSCNYKGVSEGGKISVAILTIQAVATITHFGIGLELFPVVHTSDGRRHHVVRLAEWIAMVPLMVFLLHSYDEENLIDSHPQSKEHPGTIFGHIIGVESVAKIGAFLNRFQPFACLSVLGPNALASLYSQFFATFIGTCPVVFDLAGYTLSLQITWFLYSISCVLYANLFYVFYTVVSTRKVMQERWQAQERETIRIKKDIQNDLNLESNEFYYDDDDDDDYNDCSNTYQKVLVTPARHEASAGGIDYYKSQEYYEWLAIYEKRSRASRLVLLTMICTLVWTIIVLVWFGGIFHLYSPQIENILYSCTDISSKNLFVSTLGESATRLIAVESALKKVLALEQAATQYRRKFLRFVMHEVRVPLNSVKLGLSTINDTMNDLFMNSKEISSVSSYRKTEEIESLIKIVDQSIDSMASTLNDVLSFAAIEEGRFELDCSTFNPVEMVHTVVATHEATAKSKHILISVIIKENDLNTIQLYGDHRRLGGCVSNYVSNAIKFSKHIPDETRPYDTIEILMSSFFVESVQACANLPPHSKKKQSKDTAFGLMIQVKDNGIGIAAEDQSLLFKAFSQIRPGENQQGRGSGLGLAISREIAERHGGSVGLNSHLGQGSTFYIRVPLAVISSYSESIQAIPSSTLSKLHTHNLTALVVDDCQITRKLLAAQIKRIGFKTIVQAENGAEAIKACGYHHNPTYLKYPFDVIFLDSCMPICTGPEAASILRANQCKSIILGVTGNALEEDITHFISAGADSVLTKPISRPQIVDKLTEYKSRLLPAATSSPTTSISS